MNKKLLFGIMSLAALAACTNDDFESQGTVAEQTSPIQFEVINGNEATRATMSGNKVVWSAKDKDLFTLYHGGTLSGSDLSGFENATYTANAEDGGTAVLTTPSMIKAGKAIMTWPADTTFAQDGTGNLLIKIPQNQTDRIQYEIPYVSDLIDIKAYAAYNEDATKGTVTAYNTAGKDRKYAVYMRPMASQLNLKVNYNGSDETIASLEEGKPGVEAGEGIDPISVTSVELLTKSDGTGADNFTLQVPLSFTAKTTGAGSDEARWNTAVPNNAWSHVTGFNKTSIGVWAADGAGAQTEKLTTTYVPDIKSAKFLILPQKNTVAGGVDDAAVVVKTNYGKVIVEATGGPHGGKYTTGTSGEIETAWYRYVKSANKVTTATTEENVSAGTPEPAGSENAGKFKTVAKSLALGMQQTLNYMSNYPTGATVTVPVVNGEPMGVAQTRYVNVYLKYLDMSDLHITSDKQLRNVARVWKKMNLDGVVVFLDGDANNEFKISQKTIEVINTFNEGKALADQFHVKPCNVAAHKACNTIVITGGDNVPEDLTFIEINGSKKADVAFNAGETWSWKGAVKVQAGTKEGISSFINRGTMQNAETATLKITNSTGVTQKFNIPFENAEGATWNITAGTLNVQFNVTNNGTVKISEGAQYRQDGQSAPAKKTTFTNEAKTLPNRITGAAEKIGKVENKGVFATVGDGVINNFGLIEHADKEAMTFITANQSLTTNGFTTDAKFTSPFNATSGTGNKMGQINLPYTNKDEDNISISAAAKQGFVSVTVNGEDDELDEDEVGTFVNYIIVKSGVKTISELPEQIKYVEINQTSGPRIEWNLKNTTVAPVKTAQYDGLIVKSDVNIKLGTTIAAGVTYLGADMYVSGVFNKAALATPTNTINTTATNWAGYFGDTTGNVPTKYITFGE